MSEQKTIRLYQPSNGSEGEWFFGKWCGECARDKSMREGESVDECDDREVCPIIGRTMAYRVTDPEYPQEWRYVDGVPTCTAFVPAGSPVGPTPAELEAAGQERLPL